MTTRLLCHERPDALVLATTVVDARPGMALLEDQPFHPGGGGQLGDRGRIGWAGGEVAVAGYEIAGDQVWIRLAEPVAIEGPVVATVDSGFRLMMCELHTALHIVNALAYRHFDGALVTGAQMNEDGTARIDLDLPDADNARLRAFEPEIAEVIRADLPVAAFHMPMADAGREPGLLRSRSAVPPPSPDGLVRIVEIAGLDRQACGGTHLASTGRSRPVRVLKIENKGRHNRRVRIGLVGS
ncbi:MAG: alanyl-tRNA editing protein [Alphaproteobacteria bacterium]